MLPDNVQAVLHQAEKETGAKLIYLTVSGSRLYGTHTPESDTDYMGIFMPSQDSLTTMTAPDHWTYTTGDDKSKNSVDDLDITLWSVHKFLNQLSRGEKGAIDLLFSLNRSDTIIHDSLEISKVWGYSTRHLISKNVDAFLGYAVGQAQRYGVKGARYKELYTFSEWLETYSHMDPEFRLSEYFHPIHTHILTIKYMGMNRM